MRLLALVFAMCVLHGCASATTPPDAADFCPSRAPVLALCGVSGCATWTSQQQSCIDQAIQHDAGCGAVAQCVAVSTDASAD